MCNARLCFPCRSSGIFQLLILSLVLLIVKAIQIIIVQVCPVILLLSGVGEMSDCNREEEHSSHQIEIFKLAILELLIVVLTLESLRL